MKRKNDRCVNVSHETMQDFIWMSYRYCIGRKTIAAAMHVDNIARLIRDNPDMMNVDQRLHLSEDIQNEILNVIKWQPHVKINGFGSDINGYDWFGGMLYASNAVNNRYSYDYVLDLRTSTIQLFPIEEEVKPSQYFDQDYRDLIGWYKLAKVLDKSCHRKLICEWDENGKPYRKEVIAIPFPSKTANGDYVERWMDVDDVCLSGTVFVSPECIKEIKEL